MLLQDTLKELRKKKGISQYDLADALLLITNKNAKGITKINDTSKDKLNAELTNEFSMFYL